MILHLAHARTFLTGNPVLGINRIRPIAAVFLVLAIVAPGCRKAEAPNEEPPPAPATITEPSEETIGEWTELLGTTQPLPDRVARITAAVEGHVHSVLEDDSGKPVAEGQKVEKSQVVARLDDRTARANRDKARALLNDIQAQNEQAEISEKVAKVDLDALEKLQPGDTPRETLPLVSRVALEKAKLTLESAKAQRKALAARERSLQEELKSLEVTLSYYELRAPIAGRLSALQVVPGQTLAIGGLVAEVVDLDSIDVVCPVPRHTVAHLALGQPVRFLAGHEEEKEPPKADGRIVYIAVQAQPETGNFIVKARFPNKDLQQRANTVVRVEVQTTPESKRLALKDVALMEDQDPPGVVIVEKEEEKKNDKGETETIGVARKLQAVVGVRDRSRKLVEVLRFVDPESKQEVPARGAHIIIKGGHGLENGDKVKVEEEKKEEAKKEEGK